MFYRYVQAFERAAAGVYVHDSHPPSQFRPTAHLLCLSLPPVPAPPRYVSLYNSSDMKGYHVLGDAPRQGARRHRTGRAFPVRHCMELGVRVYQDKGTAAAGRRQEECLAGEFVEGGVRSTVVPAP